MPLTPEDVSKKRFTPVRLREGYDMGEVDQFLDEVEAELDRMVAENNDLRAKLAAAGRPTARDRHATSSLRSPTEKSRRRRREVELREGGGRRLPRRPQRGSRGRHGPA